MRQRFRPPTRALVLAALAAVLMDENATSVVRRVERLLRESARDPLMVRSMPVQSLVERSVDAEIILAQEHGVVRCCSLCELMLQSEDLWIATVKVGQRSLLATTIASGTFLAVVPVGHRASVLGFRIAEWIAADEGDSE